MTGALSQEHAWSFPDTVRLVEGRSESSLGDQSCAVLRTNRRTLTLSEKEHL